MDRPGYLTSAQAMEQYGMSKFTLYRRRTEGRLTAYKFRDDIKTYWKVAELDKLKEPEAAPQAKWKRNLVRKGK